MQAEQLLQPLEPPPGGTAALQQRLAVAKVAQVAAPPAHLMLRSLRWQRPALSIASVLLLLLVVSDQPAELTMLPESGQSGPALILPTAPVPRDQLVVLPGASPQMKLYWKTSAG